jgi:hypothetical protein
VDVQSQVSLLVSMCKDLQNDQKLHATLVSVQLDTGFEQLDRDHQMTSEQLKSIVLISNHN